MNRLALLAFILCVLYLFSCARAPLVKPPAERPIEVVYPLIEPRADIYHTIAPGETLWRLGKMYNVKVEEIMQANNVTDPNNLEMGQRLLIPKAASKRAVVPIYLYNTDKWQYIIVHHSATDEDSSLSLYWIHLQRGFNEGLGYHFVIDNGTLGKGDGEIEIAPRWVKQRDGAHCKASGMNFKGIGICLVGNFSKDRVSKKQLDSLLYLVSILREHYKIPKTNILGHGHVPGARTECPGKYFPWDEFRAGVDSEQVQFTSKE